MGNQHGPQDEVAAVAAILADRSADVSGELQAVIERDIPDLSSDRQVADMLGASISGNITTLLHALQHGIDTSTIEAPPLAIEYARRLAQRGVDAASLVRAYRLGQVRFVRLFFEKLIEQTGSGHVDGPAAIFAIEQVGAYVDRIVGMVLRAYDEERSAWLLSRGSVLAGQVRSILHGDPVDIDRAQMALGYRIRQNHLGLVAWIDDPAGDTDPLRRMNELSSSLARASGCVEDPLFVPNDETSAWIWLPLGTGSVSFDPTVIAGSIESLGLAAIVAAGNVGAGLDGFRRTHDQALGAFAVSRAAGPERAALTLFRDVAPLALMCSDLDSMRTWVAETLGPLADDSARNEGLRETARIFLANGGSFTAELVPDLVDVMGGGPSLGGAVVASSGDHYINLKKGTTKEPDRPTGRAAGR